MDDFITIPNYSRYMINRCGEVYDKNTNAKLTPYRNYDGYYSYTLNDDSGKHGGVFRHRLMMMTFNPCESMDILVVNRINGIKGDDRLDNLEWVTRYENLYHAKQFNHVAKIAPIIVTNAETGETTEYTSATAAGIHFGIKKDGILRRCKYSNKIFDGYYFKRKYPKPVYSRPNLYSTGFGKRVLLRDITDGSIIQFKTITEMLNFLHIKQGTFSKRFDLLKQPVLLPSYQAKYEDDPSPWRDCDFWKEINDRTTKTYVVEVYDNHLNRLFTYPTLKDAAMAYGIDSTTARDRLKTNGSRVFRDGTVWAKYPLLSESIKSD